MSKYKRLMLTFDAFGTLFTPREAIGKQYAEVARRHGLSGFTDDQITSSFRQAFKSEGDRLPNYGKTIIDATFLPFSSEKDLPENLVPDLLARFSSAAGYTLYPDVLPFFKSLRQIKASSNGESAWSKPIVGIITNSDDRVPSILSNFGLQVGLRRYGYEFQASVKAEDDIDFVTMSYDVGFQKPGSEIFDAAKQMVPGQDRFLHVGDDLQKDYYAARRAGWEGFLLDREAKQNQEIVGPLPCLRNLQELISYIK
ncbi:MAG: hypothetical protein ASARMPREDX12_003811 [Alectoria sarmentosa]|nr:MAG: hypothetical protein ASARMPREDX12_003811 [Alectoria sarmentosa]